MKLLNQIPLSGAQKEKILKSVENYQRFARIYINIMEIKNQTVIVRIEQKELVNYKLLTIKELINRAKEAFADLPEGWKINVRALTYKGDVYKPMTTEDLKKELEDRGLKQSHLELYLGVDKHMINKLLKKEGNLTGFQKAAFNYLFKWMDSNK